MIPGVVWVVSYPKSGNTWFRAFLVNLCDPADRPANINQLNRRVPYASLRSMFDRVAGVESSELGIEEMEALRPLVYRQLAGRTVAAGETVFWRFHEARWRVPGGGPIVPAAAAARVVYLVRNPLDIAVSYAHHFRCEHGEAVELLCDAAHSRSDGADRLLALPRQRYGSWSAHVSSWVDAEDLTVHALRYEDMQAAPRETFASAAAFMGFTRSAAEVDRAIAFSAFRELRAQERAHGFEERNPAAPTFFRAGAAGQGRRLLSESQQARLVAAHGPVMRRFGYLDGDGRPA